MVDYSKQMKAARLSKFRVKIKSLAAEARIIRTEEKRFSSPGWHDALGTIHHHRVHDVRNEQRATLLAYAWHRRVPYTIVESNSKKPFPVSSVKRILKSLANEWSVTEGDLFEWLLADAKVEVAA